jgi:hypothetical protein
MEVSISGSEPPDHSDLYHQGSMIPYLIAIVAMTSLGVGSTVLILILRPTADNAALFTSIAGFIAPTTMALLAFMKTQETHVLVNGRMDEFKRLLKANAAIKEEKAREAGVAEGEHQK